MSTYTFNKFGSDAKSNTLGSVSRDNVIQDVNKKRTLLKDSSWIKTRPEDEEDKMKEENFGKSLLNRYKSQENLDKANDKEEKTSIHNRFKSDDALDRISLRNTSERGNKSATLERMPMSESDPINKRQSWAPSNKTTTTTTTTTTEESKRKSWAPTNRNTTITTTTETKPAVPSKPDGQKINIYSSDTRTTDMPTRTNFIDSARSRFEKTEEKPSLPTSPPARIDSRPAYPSKPVILDSGERRSAVDRKQRSQDLDNLIDVSSSRVVKSKGSQDLDNLIEVSNPKVVSSRGTTKYPANSSNTTSRSSTTTTTYNVTSDNSDAPSRRSSTSRTYNATNDSQDSPFRSSTTTTTYKLSDDNSEAPSRRPTTTTTTTYKDITDGPSARSNVNYTQDSWKSSPNTYGQSILSNSIKTVYSTSDRSVIEKDLCTYCRKPLGIDAKMILKDLSISCHATCFKCEACSGSLGNLKAGDSMWIYKQTIHCEPCYFSAREKWII